MTASDSIPFPTKTGNLQDIIADLSSYMQFQKQTGMDRVALSARSLEILSAWGHGPRPRKQLIHLGPASAKVALVDGAGTFFKGEAGALLKKILQAMHLAPDRVCLCNAPDADQVLGYLKSVHPVVVITLGNQAARVVIGTKESVDAIRGNFFKIQGIRVMPTLHPSRLLKDPALKRPVWEDMQQVMQINGISS